MADKINLENNYDEFFPKNYQKEYNINKSEKEEKKEINNTTNLNTSLKEYIPKKRMLNKIHPLEKGKEIFYPKQRVKFQKENKNKVKIEDSKEKEILDDEEDDYSGLAGNNCYYNKNYKYQKWKGNYRYSEDRNDFKVKWKTEMCHYWEMNGCCKFGDSCAFAHGYDELNKRKMSNNYKTKPCKQFFELGYCSYGVRCQFSHKMLKECEDENEDLRKEISYLKILSDFNDSSNEISHEVLKRPRLMTFENIASCSLDETEKNRRELYEDILAVKKKESEEPEHVFSDDTNDENSENNKNEKDGGKSEENKFNDENENKKECLISI